MLPLQYTNINISKITMTKIASIWESYSFQLLYCIRRINDISNVLINISIWRFALQNTSLIDFIYIPQ